MDIFSFSVVAVSLLPSSSIATEDSGSVMVCARLSADYGIQRNVTVELTTMNGSAQGKLKLIPENKKYTQHDCLSFYCTDRMLCLTNSK